jgi:hypothetical protein
VPHPRPRADGAEMASTGLPTPLLCAALLLAFLGAVSAQSLPAHPAEHEGGGSLRAPQSGTHRACIGAHTIPTVFLPGAAKCGTTSLFRDLRAVTPGLITASPPISNRGGRWPNRLWKEVNFFNKDAFYSKGMGGYALRYPACPAVGSGRKAIDSTPDYMRCPDVVARIHRSYPSDLRPQLRFIVILRDPTERLRSWYDHLVRSRTNLPVGPWAMKGLNELLACAARHDIDAREGAFYGSECSHLSPGTPLCVHPIAAGLYAPQVIAIIATPLSAPILCPDDLCSRTVRPFRSAS